MAGGGQRVHDLSSSHDWDKEQDSNNLEDHVDKREEKRHGANVIESLPGVGVLHWLAGPDIVHDEDPKDIHNDSHECQTNHLQRSKEKTVIAKFARLDEYHSKNSSQVG